MVAPCWPGFCSSLHLESSARAGLLRERSAPSRRASLQVGPISRAISYRPLETRLFVGGRHRLCGVGVTSMMLVILEPAALSDRAAVSRPGPGPLMRTSSDLTP